MEITIKYENKDSWSMPSHKNMDNLDETLQILKNVVSGIEEHIEIRGKK